MELIIILAILFSVTIIVYKLFCLQHTSDKKHSIMGDNGRNVEPSIKVKGYGFLLQTLNNENKVIINEEEFDYKDILECEIDIQMKHTVVVEPPQSISKSTTKTSLSSLAGRAVAGAIIAGPIGAAVGGATAKKVTTTTTTTSSGFNRHVNRKLYNVTIHTTSKDIRHTTGNEATAIKIKKAVDSIIAQQSHYE